MKRRPWPRLILELALSNQAGQHEGSQVAVMGGAVGEGTCGKHWGSHRLSLGGGDRFTSLAKIKSDRHGNSSHRAP